MFDDVFHYVLQLLGGINVKKEVDKEFSNCQRLVRDCDDDSADLKQSKQKCIHGSLVLKNDCC